MIGGKLGTKIRIANSLAFLKRLEAAFEVETRKLGKNYEG
jgi:hypothetical protein